MKEKSANFSRGFKGKSHQGVTLLIPISYTRKWESFPQTTSEESGTHWILPLFHPPFIESNKRTICGYLYWSLARPSWDQTLFTFIQILPKFDNLGGKFGISFIPSDFSRAWLAYLPSCRPLLTTIYLPHSLVMCVNISIQIIGELFSKKISEKKWNSLCLSSWALLYYKCQIKTIKLSHN